MIQQRLTYVEAPPSTNESGAFPYEPAAAYIRSRGAGGAQSTLDLEGGGTGALGATKVGPGGHRGQRGLEATFSNSGTKRGKKNRAKKSEKLRSREKKEWKLVKTMFFSTLSPNGSLDKRRKETRKRGNQERASAMIVDTYVHSIQVKAENQRSKDSRTEVTISISGNEASLLRLKPIAKL